MCDVFGQKNCYRNGEKSNEHFNTETARQTNLNRDLCFPTPLV